MLSTNLAILTPGPVAGAPFARSWHQTQTLSFIATFFLASRSETALGRQRNKQTSCSKSSFTNPMAFTGVYSRATSQGVLATNAPPSTGYWLGPA
jgi:hypothetical protein